MKIDYRNENELRSVVDRFNGCISHVVKFYESNGIKVSRSTIREHCKRHNIPTHSKTSHVTENYEMLKELDSEFKRYDDFFKLTLDKATVISDLHIPYFSLDYLKKALDVSKANKIKSLIIDGDFFDFQTISKFKKDADHKLKLEFTMGRKILQSLLNQFDEIYLIPGNHDERLGRFVDYEFDLNFLFEVLIPDNKISITSYRYCILNEDWRITHPHNYSKVKGSVAQELADVHQMNIIMGHTHYTSFSYNKSGTFECYEIGGLFDKNKIEYYNVKDTRNPKWNNGFGIYLDGYFTLFHEKSNFSKWT